MHDSPAATLLAVLLSAPVALAQDVKLTYKDEWRNDPLPDAAADDEHHKRPRRIART